MCKTLVNFKFSRFAVENKLTLSRLSICHRQKYEDFADFQQKRLRSQVVEAFFSDYFIFHKDSSVVSF